MSDEKPLLFISHRHGDSNIATAVAKVIEHRTLGAVRIFQSSHYQFDGPRVGAGLNAELRRALWDTDVLILIYTSENQNWQYCMYECGVATQSGSETNVVVLQCGRDSPLPFAADLRVDINNEDHLKRFVEQLLRDPSFFPKRGRPLAPDASDDMVEQTAAELAREIGKLISRVPPAGDSGVSVPKEVAAPAPTASGGTHTFICYARDDADFVLGLASELKAAGVNVWLDQWDIPSGADWDYEIDKALYDCRHFLIVLSPEAVNSEEVRSELRTALNERKRIVPVLYKVCRIPRRLMLIQHTNFTPAGGGRDAALKEILQALTLR
jgi:hypothetical protein